jgi:hypothetical protein
MPWTPQNQADAEANAASMAAEYNDAQTAWLNAIRSGASPVAAKGRVDDVVKRWQKSVSDLENQSDVIMSDQNTMDSLGQLATQLAEEKVVLAKLRGEAVTRGDQADSVNPKWKASPYTNILGLRRTFRESTRLGILIASILFGILALGALSFLGYQLLQPVISASSSASSSSSSNGSQTGGRQSQRERNDS